MECDYTSTHNRSSIVSGRLYSALTADLARMQAKRDAESAGARQLFDDEKTSEIRFVRQLNNNYKRKSVSPKHNVTRPTKATAIKATSTVSVCEAVKLKGRCHADGGPHWRVQESAHYGNAQQRGRKWHPTIGMHLLRAEIFVYTYLHIVMDALLMVEADALRAMQAAESVGAVHNSKSNKKKKKSSKTSAVPAPQSLCTAAAESAVKGKHLKCLHTDATRHI